MDLRRLQRVGMDDNDNSDLPCWYCYGLSGVMNQVVLGTNGTTKISFN